MVFPLKAPAADFVLGSACSHGHYWPGSRLTLRSADKRAPRCRACTSGRASTPWWLPFVDWPAAPTPAGKRLGKLCRDGHEWRATGMCIRDARGKCVQCEQERSRTAASRERAKLRQQRYADKNREQVKEKDRMRKSRPGYLEKKRAWSAKYRAAFRADGLSSTGKPCVVSLEDRERAPLDRWLKRPVLSPTVAALVEAERRRHWRECPEDGREARRRAAADAQWLRYQTRPAVRLAHREKSKRRKALMRKAHICKVSAAQIRSRFEQFGHSCAYRGGKEVDLEIEHFIALSTGGTHVLGNLLPGCKACNAAKTKHDPERWYRAQPFFAEARWRKICQVLGLKRHKGAVLVGQLTLI